ncbi:unnamed protein product [Periconia digitata]|uniref:Uncharacterized protein n=1 Tax=Periconia digitata TaxID=1303443 RepID=A0A9W4UQP3_9PLEO|nr:unnamed protein product [Periconia digitata]
MKSLYVFGHNPIQHDSRSQPHVLQAPAISVLWASWCDLIVAREESAHLEYYGTSLTPDDVAHITQLRSSDQPVFFGRALDDGVRGFVVNRTRKLTIFMSPGSRFLSIGKAKGAVTRSFEDMNLQIRSVQCLSGSKIFVSTWSEIFRHEDQDAKGMVVAFASVLSFLHFLRTNISLNEYREIFGKWGYPHTTVHSPLPIDICANAPTMTALNRSTHQVHTHAFDLRFPRCLGREDIDPPDWGKAHPVSYLSEIGARKIASGGYYTCVISKASPSSSEDDDEEAGGELYIWGQAPPGTNRELSALRTTPSSDDQEAMEDPYVKCVDLRIDDLPADVMDVAVGWGHILVAAQATKRQGTKKEILRAVFAAGCNGKQQLGLQGKEKSRDFVEDFTEVEMLRGKKVVQLVCAGWTSHVVVEHD